MIQASETAIPTSSDTQSSIVEAPKEVEVIDALNHAYPEYLQAKLTDPWEIADRKETKEVWDKTFGHPRYQRYQYATTDSKGIKQTHYLPMHGMINWLASRAKESHIASDEFSHDLDVLERYNESIRAKDLRIKEDDPARIARRDARIARELARIRKMGLSTGSDQEDLAIATDRVQTVIREFIPVRERHSKQTPTAIDDISDAGTTPEDDATAALAADADSIEDLAGAEEEIPEDMDRVLTRYWNDHDSLEVARTDPEIKAAREDLETSIEGLETLTGDKDAVEAFRQAVDKLDEIALRLGISGADFDEIADRVPDFHNPPPDVPKDLAEAVVRVDDQEKELIRLRNEKAARDLASPAAHEPSMRIVIPEDVQTRMSELVARGLSQDEVVAELAREGIILKDVIQFVPVSEPETTEAVEPPVEITDFRIGMNLIDLASGDVVFVSSIHEKSHIPELADLENNEVTLTNPRTGERKVVIRERLLEQIRNGEGFKPDDIEGRKYTDTKTGKVLTAITGFVDGRPKVYLIDESGNERGRGKRADFDQAVAKGDYARITAAKPATVPSRRPWPPVRVGTTATAPITPATITPAVTPTPAPGPDAGPPPAPDLEELDEEAPVVPPAAEPEAPAGELPPAPSTVEEIRRHLFVFANRSSDLSKRARELAEEHLRTEMRRGSILNPLNWKRKVGWRMVEHGMRYHFVERARNLLLNTGNTYADVNLATNAAVANTRGSQEYQAGLAKVEAIKRGDTNSVTGLVQTIGDGPLRRAIMNQIIKPAVEGTVTDISGVQRILRQFVIDNQRDSQVMHVFGRDASQYGEMADYFATDLLENARQIREDIAANKFALNQIDQFVDIQLANAKWGAETEIEQTRIDKFINWTQETRLKGTIFNPAVIGAGISLATYGITAIPGAAMRAGALIPFAGAIPAAFYAATRRVHDLNIDLRTHKIERAYGGQISPNAERRQDLERFAYGVASVKELLKGRRATPGTRLPQAMGGDERGLEELMGLDLSVEENSNNLLRRIAEIEERLDFSSGFDVDLVTFESRFEVEQGRLELLKAAAEGKVALRNAGVEDSVIDHHISDFRSRWQAEFIGDIQAKQRDFSGDSFVDRAFTSYRAREAWKSGAFGAAVGIAGGFFSQQALATGLRTVGVNVGSTHLENLAGVVRENLPSVRGAGLAVDVLSPKIPTVDSTFGGRPFKIPQGSEWAKGPDGKINLQFKDGGKHLLEDVRFDKRGNLRFDKDSLLAGEVREIQGEKVIREVLGKNGLWKEAATDVDRREWYRYNTGGIHEKNELRLTTGKRGNAVILSMEGMGLGREHGLKPNPIDVRELKEKGFFISLGGHSSKPLWIPVGADGHMDGSLRLDPDDYKHFITHDGKRIYLGDVAKMVINQEALGKLKDGNIATELYGRRDVFSIANDGRNGAIEAGRLIRRDGQNVAQIFATILGSEQVPDKIRAVTSTFEVTARELGELPTPDEGDGRPIDVPPIVLPFAPRFPLEPLMTAEKMYYAYNEPISNDRKELFEKNRSRTLKENPQAALDPYLETQMYFDRQDADYMEEVRALADQITETPPSNLKAMVCIPVAGHEEGDHIYDTLKNYSYQNAPSDTYEILLFVNHPEGTNLDKTLDEINRFRQDSPDIPIRVIYKEIPTADAKMAVIRKYLNDVALYRHHERGTGAGDIILISNDADLKGVAPEYIENFINKFAADPQADGLTGQLDWDPESYIEYPVIHAGTRLFQYLNLLLWKDSPGSRASSGANFAFRGSIYAGIGGYQVNDMPGAEDVILGQAIRAARGGSQTLGYGGTRVSRIYTSSRRSISAWKNNYAPVEQWDRNWGVVNEDIRRILLGRHAKVNYKDPAQVEKIKKDLEWVIDRTLAYYAEEGVGKDAPLFKKAVGFLGIDYILSDTGGVEITDMARFLEGIERYQDEGMNLMRAKAGQPTTASNPTPSPTPTPSPAPTAPTGGRLSATLARAGSLPISAIRPLRSGLGALSRLRPRITRTTPATPPPTPTPTPTPAAPDTLDALAEAPVVPPAAPAPTPPPAPEPPAEPEPIPTPEPEATPPPTATTAESTTPPTVEIGTTVYGRDGSEYHVVDSETIAGVRIFNVQPVGGNPNIRFSVTEKELLSPTRDSRFRLVASAPETPDTLGALVDAPVVPPATSAPAEAVETEEPKDLVEAINEKVEGSTERITNYEIDPSQLEKYLKLIPIPYWSAASVQNAESRIIDGKLNIKLGLVINGKQASIQVRYVDTPLGLVVETDEVTPPFRENALKPNLQRVAEDLEANLRSVINLNINPEWQISTLLLSGNKVGMGLVRISA